MKAMNYLALILAAIGCINWGLVGLFDFNLVSFLFGTGWIARAIYILVGISGVWILTFFSKLNSDY